MFGLDPFLGELSRDEFTKGPWTAGWHLVRGEIERFSALAQLRTFESPWSMVAAHRGDIDVFGPGGVRVVAEKQQADELYGGGCTLYLELRAPELDPFRETLARELGCSAADICVEGFASKAGSVSTGHFDPEHNFHVILRGKKRWRLAKNESVDTPVQNYVIGSEAHKESVNHRHKHAPLPTRFPAEHEELEVSAGDSLYFARGVWHEVECDEDALSVNFAVRPPSWARMCSAALGQLLDDDPTLRAYAFESDRSPEVFEALVQPRVAAALEKLSLEALLAAPLEEP